jgi:formyltetrahydrofolate deformylase
MTNNYEKTLIKVTVIGKDRKGVVADITNFIFRNGGNIEKINQNVVRGLFGMQLEASFQKLIMNELDFGLKRLSEKLDMEIKVHYQEPNRIRNVAILVSNEDHCLMKILEAKKKCEINANLSASI